MQWKSGDLDVVAEVDEEIIAEVLSTATGIPVFQLTEEESARLLRMEDELGKRYIGQHEAVRALSRSIRRTRAGLKDPKRPSGSFIFAGPSGVGKTELTKALTEFLFGDENALIQLDMSEYSEKHTASRLFGSPPGYVGYEEGGQLTEKVRRKPFSVVLFDEVEKAHPDIFNSLLQILDEGRLTDAQGRVVDFKNTVIVMTTNLGTRDIAKSVSLGFSQAGDAEGSYEKMKAKVADELKQHFRPEFLNRVDEIVVFRQLTQVDIERIVDLMVAQIEIRLKDKDMGIELTPAAKTLIAQRGFDPVLGARPLRRAIQRDIEDHMAEKILFSELKPGEIVVVDVADPGFGVAVHLHRCAAVDGPGHAAGRVRWRDRGSGRARRAGRGGRRPLTRRRPVARRAPPRGRFPFGGSGPRSSLSAAARSAYARWSCRARLDYPTYLEHLAADSARFAQVLRQTPYETAGADLPGLDRRGPATSTWPRCRRSGPGSSVAG